MDPVSEKRRVLRVRRQAPAVKEYPLAISTPFIRLDAALKFSGAAETGGQAKLLIEDGGVTVNGEVCFVRGRKLRPGDTFRLAGARYRIEADADQ